MIVPWRVIILRIPDPYIKNLNTHFPTDFHERKTVQFLARMKGFFMLRGVQLEKGSYVYFPGGNFKDCLFSSLPGEMTLFDSYVSYGLKAPTSFFIQKL